MKTMKQFPCSYLKGVVELTDERFKHIAESHPDFLPEHEGKIPEVLADPDQIRRSHRFPNALMFTRWFTNLNGGKFVVIVVVTDSPPTQRSWIVTGYIARKIKEGEVEWKRS